MPSVSPGYALRLNQFSPGIRFNDLILAVMSVSQKRTKSGNEYLYFRLRDASGETQGKWFSPTLAARELENAALVQISGRVDDHESFRGELKIDALVPIFEIPADLTTFQTRLRQNDKEHLSRF